MSDQKTAYNTRHWLKGDFQMFLKKSKLATVLPSSMQLSDMPGGGPAVSVDDKLVGYFEAKVVVDTVCNVFSVLGHKQKRILELCFIDGLEDWQVMERVEIESEPTYYRTKQKALVAFAELYGPFNDFRDEGSEYLF